MEQNAGRFGFGMSQQAGACFWRRFMEVEMAHDKKLEDHPEQDPAEGSREIVDHELDRKGGEKPPVKGGEEQGERKG
ncbi:hypothetical protein NGM99_15755 [Mesorhizobium sp. RP14(2022)]|uniref:Uncharacterized protein n=1 Tax=Mesorhizobium liriopis TaxID=2953882 RepID=A0ABT1C8S1_9HYPH|nr:hypothetical protein [Mesorhizobium liriopis]MCO6051240.1 hypothetical protein [Mesorhizobium liriopis]